MQPGQFLKLHNLHAALHKREEAARGDNANTFPKLELAIHRGTSYGRGVAVLHEQCPEVLAVKQRMERPVSSQSCLLLLLLMMVYGVLLLMAPNSPPTMGGKFRRGLA